MHFEGGYATVTLLAFSCSLTEKRTASVYAGAGTQLLCTVDKVKAIDSIIFMCWIKMKCSLFGICPIWYVLYLEYAQNGVAFLECDHNESCSFWNVLFLNGIKIKCAQNVFYFGR